MRCQFAPNADGTVTCSVCGWTSRVTLPTTAQRDCGPVQTFPAPSRPPAPPPPSSPGPGTYLAAILARLGFHHDGGCACDAHAAEMDRQGADWCEQHLELIVDWLADEARRRGLPFVRTAGRLLVRWAIRRARRNAE